MRLHQRVIAIALSTLVAATAVAVTSSPAHAAGVRPMFQLPFACGDSWRLATYQGHDDYDIDMSANSGTTNGRPILAAFGGTVAFAGWSNGGGWYVKLNHGGGWQTLYLHMIASPPVSTGQTVGLGQWIGNVGSTGDSGAPHLHHEQLADGNKVESWFNGVASGIRSDGSAQTGPLYIGGPVSAPVNVTSRNCGHGVSSVHYGGLLRFFARGLDGQLIQYINQNGQWAWQALGGNILGNPSAIVDGAGLRVFATGADGTPWQYHFDGTWHMTPINTGKITGGTSAVYYSGAMRFFARGLDGQLIQYISQNGQWIWQALGGTIIGTPDVIEDGAGLRVFVTGADGTPWQYHFDGTWHMTPINTGKITGGTSAVYYSGAMRFFARGLDGQLIQYISQNGQWIWQALGGTIIGSPGAIVDGTDLRVFVTGADGTPWQYHFDGTWHMTPINTGKIT